MTLAMFFWLLSALIIVGSAVWIAVDAQENRITLLKGEYSIVSGALPWGLLCLLVWIVGFPLYVIHRRRQLIQRGEADKAFVGLLSGLGVIAAQLLAVGLALTVGRFAGQIQPSVIYVFHLPVLIIVVSVVYSATRYDQWGAILKEAVRWGLRLTGFLAAVAGVLMLVNKL
jgi:hypothetical protein